MEVQDLEMLCRACTEVLANANNIDHAKHNLFLSIDLAKKFTVCTSLNVEPMAGFPKYLCNSCYGKLDEFHQFQLMCVESAQRYLELIQLRESLEETSVFDLGVRAKVKITVEEPSMLLSDCQVERETRGNRRIRRNCMAKILGKFDSKAQALPNQLPKRSITLRTEITNESNEEQSKEVMETLSNDCDYRIFNKDGIEEEYEEKEKQIPFAKQQMKPKICKTKCQDDTSFGHSRRIFSANLIKSSTVYQCDVCPMRFFAEHRLEGHKREHDGLVPYPCPREGCPKSFHRWNRLSHHLKQHDGNIRFYKCEEDGCCKEYQNKETLVKHLRKHNKSGPELTRPVHVCEICGKVLKSAAILNDHRYTHKGKSELPFACDQPGCARRFTKSDKLKVHLMRHAGIKNFECPHCGMRKTTRHELKAHINYHTRERTWPCRFCAQIFNNAGNMKRHVRTVHEGVKDYACCYCERTFAKPDTRKYHEMTHTGEKPNECEECGKRFTQPIALRTHKKMHQRRHLLSISVGVESEKPKVKYSGSGEKANIAPTTTLTEPAPPLAATKMFNI